MRRTTWKPTRLCVILVSLALLAASSIPLAAQEEPEPGTSLDLVPLDDFAEVIDAAALRNGVDPNLVRAIIVVESGGDPNAQGGAGQQGLMGLMPGLVAEYGVTDPFDPAQNIEAGTRFLSTLLLDFEGDVRLAVAAYDAGPAAVHRYGDVPPIPEVRHFVDRVLHVSGDLAPATPAPAPADPLGTQWTNFCETSQAYGKICGTLTRRGTGDTWDLKQDHGAVGVLTITSAGRDVSLVRGDPSGASSGLYAEYTGTLSDDYSSASGTVRWIRMAGDATGTSGPWTATIVR